MCGCRIEPHSSQWHPDSVITSYSIHYTKLYDPTIEPITTTIPGTVTVNGAQTSNFVVSTAGTVVATLTSLTPDAEATVGFALGTFNGTACQTVIVNDSAFQGAILIGATGSSAVLCVRVYDVGALTAPTNYAIERNNFV